ncbi:hypothetical protein ACI6Q2_15595 [Chitinophagaceae bacterium LWZ2-11]
MQFPRINSAVNITLLYYTKSTIQSEVGLLSGELSPVKHIFNEKELPSWNILVLNMHQSMEEEIQQIINLNYLHVRNIVFENLREILTDVRIKTVNKEWITSIADEINKEGEAHLVKYPQGFAVMVNKEYLPAYFKIVDTAISNLKRIINKYLTLHDTGKLQESYHLSPYLPPSTNQVIKESNDKLELNITTEQLALLCRLLDETGVLKYKQKKEVFQFLLKHIKTKTDSSNLKYFSNKFYDIEKAAHKFWKDQLAEMLKLLSTKLK